MRVNLDTPLTDALARSMTRAKASRFDPLLATDNAGRFAGIARLERIVMAVVDHTAGNDGAANHAGPTGTATNDDGDPA
jgi:hypothetical protein